MTLPRFDFSTTKKPAQVQENLITYYRLFAPLPGMVMVDNTESFYFIGNKPSPDNMVFRTRWPGDGSEERIDDIFAQIGLHTNEIDWMIFPGDSPRDLSQRLESRGMPAGRGGNWLWADLASPVVPPSVPPGFHVEQVQDNEGMAAWVRISEEGFGGELGCYYDAYARHGYGSDAFSYHYIGYLGNTPVTSGTLLDAGGCASIYDLSTPPAYRRQGFGSFLMLTLMDEIRKRGYPDTWIWSSEIGRSVYQKLGYSDADFGLREHSWRNH
jgi:GNAT superfamily N-acetyltransferase